VACLVGSIACSEAPAPKAALPAVLGPQARSPIETATEYFYAGKQSALSGDFECAELQFQQALDAVVPPDGSLPRRDEVEEFSLSLYESILRYEVMAQAASETDAAERGGTPEELLGVSGQSSEEELAEARQKIGSDQRAATFDIPITTNDAVVSMVASFTSRDSVRQRFAAGLVRSGRYMPMIRSVFVREGLPEDLAYVAMIESSFKTSAHSRARAHGVWQFIVPTGRRYGLKTNRAVDERADPVKSTEAAANYFKDLYELFNDWYLAMAAYDSGEKRVARAIERTGSEDYWELCRAGALPRETRLYVPSVIAAALIAKNPSHYGFAIEPDPPLAFETVTLDRPVSLKRLARETGIEHSDLKELNPELKTDVTPRDPRGYKLRLPEGSRMDVEVRLASIPEASPPSAERQHRVRKGETLARVARKFGVTPAALAEANDLEPDAALTPRAVLTIPEKEPAVRHASGKNHRKKAGSDENGVAAAGSKPSAPPAVYRVRKGDTLYRIANKNHTSVDSIRQWNGLDADAEIHPGDHLRVGPAAP
jgi:membrane-bound lytic murein transglycosylase D